MTEEYSPVVDIDTQNGEYEVCGFDSEDEAREFIQEIDEETSGKIIVSGPF